MAETWVVYKLASVVSRRSAAPAMTPEEIAQAQLTEPDFVPGPSEPGPEELIVVAVPGHLDDGAALLTLRQVWSGQRDVISVSVTDTNALVVERV
jgi:hypothetical protein